MSIEGKDIANAVKRRPIVFGCAALIFIFLVVMYWRSGAIPTLQAEVDDRSAVLQKTKANVTYSVQLDAQLKALADINARIRASALRADDLAQNQQFFYLLEAETGVTMTRFGQQKAPDKIPAGGAYLPVIFSITVEGDYRQILTFLKRIESGPALSRVSGAMLMIGGNSVPSLDLTVEILGLRQ